MEQIERIINYKFKDKELLKRALTHSSFANERHDRSCCNERLEFLGDSVLSIIVSEKLYSDKAQLPEGELTRRRAMLVCESSLFEMAGEISLGEHLKLGKGEKASGGKERPSILADAMEALIAAIYLDGGMEAAREFVLSRVSQINETDDYKTRLQELTQSHGGKQPVYVIKDRSGPDHKAVFTVQVSLDGNVLGEGVANSKKAAQQTAAKLALKALTEKENT